MRYPPFVSLLSAVVRGTTFRAADARGGCSGGAVAARSRVGSVSLGPAPAPIGRLRGQYRVQLFLKGPQRREMREAMLAALDGHAELKRRIVIDVDPLSMM